MKTCVSHARSAVLSLTVAAAWPAFSQTASSPQLRETVVTATRTAQPLSDLLADVTVVDRDTIERSGATGLADVLARLPGVEFQRNGGPGTTTGVFLRGSESRFTAVYIDGVRIDSQATGGAAWESIPLGQIDRIEVLRGPAAAVYGSDALGGVVQIFTKRGEGPFAPFVGIGFGSHGTRKADAGFSGSQGAFDYSLGLVDERSEGFNSRTAAGQNPDLDGYRSRSANAKLGFQLNRAHRLEASVLANDVNSQYDSASTRDDRNLRELNTLGLNWQARWTEAYSTRLSISDSRDRYQTTPSPYLSVTDLRSYLLHNEFRLGSHLFTAALERKEDHLQNAPIDRGRSQDALALGYGWKNGPHAVQLNVRHDDDSEFGAKKTGSAGYGFAITPQWRVTASTGTAFRAPTLYHRFSIYGVSTLQPESSRNKEIGLRYEDGGSSFGIVAYQNKVSNLITFTTGSGPCTNGRAPVALANRACYSNTAQAEYSGVTLTGGYKLGNTRLSASLDLQNPRDLGTGRTLARRARQHAVLAVDTRVGPWSLGAEAQLSGRRNDSATNTVVLGGYGLINLSASTLVARDWTFLARVDNLADKSYELAQTYATGGRTVYVGLKWAPL
ncbi:MAG: TonB-dependent receptor [Polaromonas sp.]|uniref:TonB-dependent receptor domain-containing protein n=1 Tax=Polaromonas sp. TaxID=1869339 RepID=UPI002489D941|nr:TonB-dependent receptor [Polaromonas sp.]MDI1271414.1 TonB-dependent receptor [Polaromonas sp.]